MPSMTQNEYKKRKASIEKLMVFPGTEDRPAEFRFHGKRINIITAERIKSKKIVRLIACWYFIKFYSQERLNKEESGVIKTNIEDLLVDEFRTLIMYTPKKGKTLIRIEDPVFLLDNILADNFHKFANFPFCITMKNFNEEFELFPYKLEIIQ